MTGWVNELVNTDGIIVKGMNIQLYIRNFGWSSRVPEF